MMKHSLPNMRVLLHTLFVGVWWRRWRWGGGPLPRGSLLRSGLNLCWFHGLKKPTKGVDVEVVNACLICLMLNQKKKFCATVDPTCLLRIASSSETFSLGRMRLWSVSYSLREKHTENIYLKKKNTCFKKWKHVCFLLFVLGIFMLPLLLMCQCCGRDLHLATHATILWCRPRMYQHEIKHLVIFFRNAVCVSMTTLKHALVRLTSLQLWMIHCSQ